MYCLDLTWCAEFFGELSWRSNNFALKDVHMTCSSITSRTSYVCCWQKMPEYKKFEKNYKMFCCAEMCFDKE